MNLKMKSLFKESLYIAAFALLISMIYNHFNPKGINIFEKPKIVSDTVLERFINRTDTAVNLRTPLPDRNNEIKPSQPKDLSALKTKEETPEVQNYKQAMDEYQETELQNVSLQQLKKLLGKPNLILIDARSPRDFQQGHIDGAINIFAFEENIDIYFKNLTSVPFDSKKIIIVYCEGGTCEASNRVAEDLYRLGHRNVFVFPGGWEEWTQDNK